MKKFFYNAINKGLAGMSNLFDNTVVSFGKFILTKWNRNYFFLLLGMSLILELMNKFDQYHILIGILICSTIAILSSQKDIGKSIEDKK
jgi:hypothetical protein